GHSVLSKTFSVSRYTTSVSLSLIRVCSHRVILGEHNRGSNDEPIQIQVVSKVITHPLYNSVTFNNDIALLKLSSPVTFTPSISPVCLASSGASIVPGTRCFTTGWGQTASTSQSAVKQKENNNTTVFVQCNVSCFFLFFSEPSDPSANSCTHHKSCCVQTDLGSEQTH
uniref:Zgc:171592 n=1 Tax=Cyprinus carpio carpio TaxID=630221 RepID=A0A9J7X7V8_CYPCA